LLFAKSKPFAARVQTNLNRTLMEHHRPSKELLLQPLPLELPCLAGKEFKRTLSVQATPKVKEERAKETDGAAVLAPLPTGISCCIHAELLF
jgi:hypothetical protein